MIKQMKNQSKLDKKKFGGQFELYHEWLGATLF